MLRRVKPSELASARPEPVDPQTLVEAQRIVESVRAGGEGRLRNWAEKLDGLAPGAPLLIERAGLQAALKALPSDQRGVLERTAERIARFAEAQKSQLAALDTPIPGGRAGHSIEPIERVGCYAPGGRFPLPSSALMTAIPARVAGSSEGCRGRR